MNLQSAQMFEQVSNVVIEHLLDFYSILNSKFWDMGVMINGGTRFETTVIKELAPLPYIARLRVRKETN